MANPFFSGRIPQDLYDRIDQYIAETGESKTDVLVKALGAYLNHPVSRPSATPTISEERFTALEEQVTSLQLAFEQFSSKTLVINSDNKRLSLLDSKPDTFDNTDNNSTEIAAILEDSQQQNSQTPDNLSDNIDNINHEEEKVINLLPKTVLKKFENLTSIELSKETELTLNQLDGRKKKIIEKYQKMGQPLENKKLLESPEKIESFKPIMINDYPYDLFYLGQNESGKNLWTALPYDNNRYQQLSLEREHKNT